MKKTLLFASILTMLFSGWTMGRLDAATRCCPTNRFVVVSPGVVQDTLTLLKWQQDGSGPRAGCSGPSKLTCKWSEADAYCSGLSLSDDSGWRLPTAKELLSLVDLTKASPGPTIDQAAFPKTPADSFWTSSPYAGSAGIAWYVNFSSGISDGTLVSADNWVRCVR